MEEKITNKVAESGIITIDLEQFYPSGDFVELDIKNFLFMEMILKEKDFREKLKTTDWEIYRGKNVGIVCSADAVIPMWAYMLLMTYLQPVCNEAGTGDSDEMKQRMLLKNLSAINSFDFADARVVIKGCGDLEVGAIAYAEITRILLPVARSIMYGEPCSTVPVYKRK